MSIEGLLLGFVILSVVILFVALPLLRHDAPFDRQAVQIARQRERAHLYYERVLRNLRDLDEDQTLGKLDDDSYRQEREVWARRGVEVLKALDALEAGTLIAAKDADDAQIDRMLDDVVEAAVAEYREKAAN
jgi:hypothetical protein